MAININAKTTGVGGLETSADNSGNINIQSGGSTVMSVTSSGVAVTGSFSQNGAVYSTQPSFRNLIINGDMRIDQRNAGASVTPTANAYLTDRWQLQTFGITNHPTFQQVTDAPTGFKYSLKATVNSSEVLNSGNSVTFRQRIEGYNIAHLNWGTANAKTIAVSFWVKSSLTGTFNVSISNSAFNRAYIAEYTISSANTWEYKTVTIAGDTTGAWNTDNTTGLLLMFNLDSGSDFDGTADTWLATNDRATVGAVKFLGTSGATFYITGVQLEVGSTATEFEHLPYDVQLARCQRYYYKSFNQGVTPADGVVDSVITIMSAYSSDTGWSPFIPFPVPMRTAPTTTPYRDTTGSTAGQWTYYNSGYTSLTSTSLSPNGTTTGVYCNGSRTSAFSARDSYLLRGNFTADAEL